VADPNVDSDQANQFASLVVTLSAIPRATPSTFDALIQAISTRVADPNVDSDQAYQFALLGTNLVVDVEVQRTQQETQRFQQETQRTQQVEGILPMNVGQVGALTAVAKNRPTTSLPNTDHSLEESMFAPSTPSTPLAQSMATAKVEGLTVGGTYVGEDSQALLAQTQQEGDLAHIANGEYDDASVDRGVSVDADGICKVDFDSTDVAEVAASRSLIHSEGVLNVYLEADGFLTYEDTSGIGTDFTARSKKGTFCINCARNCLKPKEEGKGGPCFHHGFKNAE